MKKDKLAELEKDWGYHKHLLAKTAMFRYKQLLDPKRTLRNYNDQVSEALINVKEINKVVRLSMPVRQKTN
ncbi:hypothetical protein [Candidatus Enterovibrio escicola]|uniref:hypothetical protein n=1 Tax=Candidatus Enterovibrio escicola TaxID=1927127 RepID=UPI0011BA9717|nr:hypothetical protein [Candidatus Enterovibrio escacola]